MITAPSREEYVRGVVAEAYREKANERVDYELEPLIDGQPLHPGQRQAWISEYRFIAIFAGWQSGKTVIGAWWLLREMQRRGPGDYAVIVPNYPILQNKALPELEDAFRGVAVLKKADNCFEVSSAGAAKLGWESGSRGRILLRHAERADAIEAFTAKGMWIDEPGQIADEVWKSIKPRGMVYKARILMTSRPYRFNWYVHEIWRRVMDKFHRRKPDADPLIEVVNFASTMNPAFDKSEYNREKELMPDWEHSMKYDGIPERPAGVVYDCYDPERNDFDPLDHPLFVDGKVPAAWPLWVGVDFGLVNTAAVLIAEELKRDYLGYWLEDQPTGNYYVVGAYSGNSATALDHIKGIRKLADSIVDGGTAQRPKAVGGSHQESGWRESWALSGLAVAEPSVNLVGPQISCTYAAIKTGKLKFSKWLTKLLADIETFSYETDPLTGEKTEELEDEHKYHRLAALRYISTRLFKAVERKTQAKLSYGMKD